MFTHLHTQENAQTIPRSPNSDQKSKVLYLGDTSFYHKHFSQFFLFCALANSYSGAKKLLSTTATIPDIIIIDLPLNHFDLVAFIVWLRSKELQHIPIIYNQATLNLIEIRQIFNQKLVDDVVDLEKHYQKLPYKINFIQKIKKAQSASSSVKNTLSLPYKSSSLKIILDTILTAIILAACLPLFILIALAIKLESKGPVFYCSNRAGKGFKIFKFFKFRTMIMDADKHIKDLESLNQYRNTGKLPVFFKIKDDPRVTRVGSILRKTSLDELPQLFNVLKGDMSLVGNRPLPLYEAATLTTDEWAERFMAPAGITGLWQVSKRGKPLMSNEERILLDIQYARTWSLKGDLKIMFQTPAALLQQTNA
jgi:lipopolysaccharide/colanic/teichoic acid biosynthesis glycosyltransferase